MPLQSGIQVVLQHPQADGTTICRSFTGLPITNPAYFCVYPLYSGDELNCELLGNEIAEQLAKLGPGVNEVTPPCGGTHFGDCHALREPDCIKVLLPVIGNQGIGKSKSLPIAWQRTDASFKTAPVFLGVSSFKLLPNSLKTLNGLHWSKGDVTAITEILRLAHIFGDRPRLFLSYARKDSSPLADQLFDQLIKMGFDVFLDRFSIPPAADFQQRLTEELSRIGTILLLESQNTLTSQWVRYEADFARLNRLALVALNLPGGPITEGVARDCRTFLNAQDFTQKHRLRAARIKTILASIAFAHGNAERRRKAYLRDALSNSLLSNGFSNQAFTPSGVVLARKGNDYAFRISHLPPEIGDFHMLEDYRGTHTTAVFAPAKYMDWRTRRPIDWLSQVSTTELHDEADMLNAIRLLK